MECLGGEKGYTRYDYEGILYFHRFEAPLNSNLFFYYYSR
jgi:hypothetical protein